MENDVSLLKKDKTEVLSALVDKFEAAEEATRDARKLAERDRDYYDGKQWTDAEVAALKKRKQPVVTFNRIQRKVDYLSGMEKQVRKDPKAFPRNPDDEQAAEAATDAIRYVCDDSNWDDVRSEAFDNLQVEGIGVVFVGHKETRNGIDPTIFNVPWDRFFHDPHSAKHDFSDASYMGIVTWYDVSEAERKWPEGKEALQATLEADRHSETYDDKPKDKLWSDYKRRRVRVIEVYCKTGEGWTRAVLTKGGFLEEEAPSPYIDEDGQPENPIKAVSLYVDRDNNRYGGVRVLISPQDEVNKRRSKGLHLITMRQARYEPSGERDAETIRRELAKPDGIIEASAEDFEILPTSDLARGNFEMLQEAKAEIDMLGANAALQGKQENDMSGRAILAQQQGGMVEVARLFDRLRHLSMAVYRATWNRIRQFWQQERWVRVTDNENRLRFVGLNQQVTIAQLAQEVAEGDEEAIAKASQIVGPELMQAFQAGDERAQAILGMFIQQHGETVVETRNAVNELDVDIVIDEGMDTPTMQAEQFDTLAKMLGSAPPDKQGILWEALFENSALRNKEAIIEKIKEGQQADPMQQQLAQIMAQLQVMAGQADIAKTESETVKNNAMAASATMGTNDPVEQQLRAQENVIKAYDAETKREQVMQRPAA
ncbi:hypothetical protein WJS89_10545 [Sphingomicrobium sp. XHP0235]|uniref:portal protein n=1 Tax=Sphingomicrobium aquimarinum TaxID=3133971 RepID=UPI0031FE73BB